MEILDIDRGRLLPHDKAFNCSIAQFRGKTLMAYRIEEHKDDAWAKIAICELGRDWQPIKQTNRMLNIRRPHPHSNLLEDPRLYVSGDRLSLSFIAATVGPTGHVATQGFTFLEPDTYRPWGEEFPQIGNNLNFAFDGRMMFNSEKNWTFHGDDIIYSLNPLVVRSPGSENRTMATIPWDHGRLSGSTQLIEWEGKLLGMFHSFVHKLDKNHPGGMRRHYATGWYVIDPATWRMVAISKEPVLIAVEDGHDLRPQSQEWKPNVVFPCGLMDLGDKLVVSYGWQDSVCRLAFIPHEEVERNLIPITEHFIQKQVLNDPYVTPVGGFDCEVEGKKFHARSWNKLVIQTRPLGIKEQQLHDAIVPRIPESQRKTIWAPA